MLRRAAVEPTEDADEPFDLRYFGRSIAWAGMAFAAMVGAFAAARSENGLRRINEAINYASGTTLMADLAKPGNPRTMTVEADAEARRLAGMVKTLTADRERVMARLAALERSVDVTGSLPPPAKENPPAKEQPPIEARPSGETAGPVAASVTLIPPAASTFPGLPPTGTTLPSRPQPAANSGAMTPNPAAESTVTQTQFGIDLGSEEDIESLRKLWNTIKSQHGTLVEGLRPVVAAYDTGRRGAVAVHLIVGPLDNAAAAARICAALATSGQSCRPTAFEGQRLALR